MTFEQRIDEAFDAFHEGDLQQAKRLFAAIEKDISPADEDYDQYLHAAGYYYSAEQDFDKARTTYQTLLDKADNPEEQHVALHQLGMVERMDSEFDKAHDYFNQEQQLLDQHFPDDSMRKSVNLYEHGYVLMQEGRYDEAEAQLQQSLEFGTKAEDDMCIACAHRALGELNAAQSKVKEAKMHFTASKKHFNAAGEQMGVQEIEMLASIIFAEE